MADMPLHCREPPQRAKTGSGQPTPVGSLALPAHMLFGGSTLDIFGRRTDCGKCIFDKQRLLHNS
jgi:hypothetical protein